jgi:multisubunit Na+/H+ antiporter MnhF subunit
MKVRNMTMQMATIAMWRVIREPPGATSLIALTTLSTFCFGAQAVVRCSYTEQL